MLDNLKATLDNETLTLTQVLASIGWTHAKTQMPHYGGRDIYTTDGTYVGVYRAEEVWDMLRAMANIPHYERTLDTFADGIITKVSQSDSNGLWYAVLDVGPKSYVSDPDFATCGKTRNEAVFKCAKKIRDDAGGIGKYAPHSILTQGKYDFSHRLAEHWANKERAASSIPSDQAA